MDDCCGGAEMTGYESKRTAARDKLAQPAQEREALKLALEFVENVHFGEWQGSTERQEEAITAIQEALAQAAQKPIQVSPLEFVEMVMDKEHLVGNPIVWTQWPNKENT